MEEYKKMDGWLYLEYIAKHKKRSEELVQKLINKYKGTAVECDPINYEYELLVKAIRKSKGYINAEQFLRALPDNMQEAFYQTGVDCMLR